MSSKPVQPSSGPHQNGDNGKLCHVYLPQFFKKKFKNKTKKKNLCTVSRPSRMGPSAGCLHQVGSALSSFRGLPEDRSKQPPSFVHWLSPSKALATSGKYLVYSLIYI